MFGGTIGKFVRFDERLAFCFPLQCQVDCWDNRWSGIGLGRRLRNIPMRDAGELEPIPGYYFPREGRIFEAGQGQRLYVPTSSHASTRDLGSRERFVHWMGCQGVRQRQERPKNA